MSVMRSTSIRLPILVGLLVAACTPSVPSPVPNGSQAVITNPPSESPAPSTPTMTDAPTVEPEPSAEPSPEPTGPVPSLPCPSAKLLSVREFVEASWQCFRDHDVRVKGWLDNAPSFGFEGPAIHPLWLAYPETRECLPEGCTIALSLWQDVTNGDYECSNDSEAYCSYFFFHTAPGSNLHLGPLQRWLILTGHTSDSAAERCHYEYPPGEDPYLDDAMAVEHCRTQFVVTEVDVVDSP